MQKLALLAVKPVGCESCIGLCCKAGMRIPFTSDEAELIRNSGTELSELPDGDYKMETDCGNLREDTETATTYCAIYEDPSRPWICGKFTPGGLACRALRAAHEIDTAYEFDQYLVATGQTALAAQTM